MTVAELIEALSKVDPSLPVKAEGCDCINPASGVSVEDGYVCIDIDPYASLAADPRP